MKNILKNKISVVIDNKEINYKIFVFVVFALRSVHDIFLAFINKTYMPLYAKAFSLIIYATVPLGVLYIIKNRHVAQKNLVLLILPITYWIFLVLNTYGGYDGDWLTALVAICCFLLMSDVDKCNIFDMFYWIVQVCNIISLIIYFCYLSGINIGFTSVLYYADNSNLKGLYYQKWWIFAIFQDGLSYRLCGIFNEPGGLGTICALLCIARFKYSKLWEKVVLVITILFTYSLAGYLLLFLYAMFYLAKKNWKYIIFSLVFVILLLEIPKIDWGNDSLNKFAKRFEITSEGLNGDNRTTKEYDEKFENLLNSRDKWFGKGYGYNLATRSSSYKTYIVSFGIIGFVILFSQWIFFSVKYARNNLDCMLLLFFFFLSLYQRPSPITSIYGYVLLFGGMEWILMQTGVHTNKRISNISCKEYV